MGMQTIFKLRGPESFRVLPDRSIFQSARLGIISASLVLRRPTILSQQCWKDTPWQRDLDQKNMIEHLIDILADCPNLMVLKDQALSEKSEIGQQNLVEQLTAQIQNRLEQLFQWKCVWDATELNSRHEVPTSNDTPTHFFKNSDLNRSKRIWDTTWFYTSSYHANAISLFHATHIQILLQLPASSSYTNLPNLPNLLHSAYISGIEICRSVDYHLKTMREGAGSPYLLFLLRMAWEATGKVNISIGIWLQGVLRKIETGLAGRWALAGYLLDIQSEKMVSERRVERLDP